MAKITLPRLATLMSDRNGKSKKFSEDFIKVFFSTIAEAVAEGQSVKVKDLGIFKIVRVEERKSVNVVTGEEYIIPAHNKLSFLPSKQLAETVNSPFVMFETVELADGFDPDDFESENSESTLNNILPEEEIIRDTIFQEDIVDPQPSLPERETMENKPQTDISEPSLPNEDLTTVYSDVNTHPDDAENITDELENITDLEANVPIRRRSSRNYFGRGFLLGFGCALLLILIVFGLGWYFLINDKTNSEINSGITAKLSPAIENREVYPLKEEGTDTLINTTSGVPEKSADYSNANEAVPTMASDSSPVYDYVSTTRYLTTIAKEHYGNFDFWPYIYEENKAILGHPNKIKPGTRVIVPPLSKYGVSAASKEDIRVAKRKGAEIYSRYN